MALWRTIDVALGASGLVDAGPEELLGAGLLLGLVAGTTTTLLATPLLVLAQVLLGFGAPPEAAAVLMMAVDFLTGL